jgi:hypothetical protein
MSLENYKPVVFHFGLNRVVFGDTPSDEIPRHTPLYYMLPIGTLEQVKKASGYGTTDVRSGLNPELLLGQTTDVLPPQLYYDTSGGIKQSTGIGGKRKTKSNRTKKRWKKK